jgi:hypothetical protein
MQNPPVDDREMEFESGFTQTAKPRQVRLGTRARPALRWAMLLYLCYMFCPFQYMAPSASTFDNSWLFALNYAAAHHLILGQQIAWTYGPLAYLLFPFDMTNNLAKGLAFQGGLWLLVVAILADLFFCGGLRLRNLAAFSILGSFFVPDYRAGLPLIFAALVLLVRFRMRGGTVRYLGALLILGLTPLIEFYGAMIAAGIVVGLLFDFLMSHRNRSTLDIALAVVVPALVGIVGCRLALGSFRAVTGYIQSSLELVRGYSQGMSAGGSSVELMAAVEAIVLVTSAMILLARIDIGQARFFSLILIVPLFLNFKHGFCRQDTPHVTQFFCFAALVLALVSIAVPLQERVTQIAVIVVLLLFATLWQDYVLRNSWSPQLSAIPGTAAYPTVAMVWNAFDFGRLRRLLNEEGSADFQVAEPKRTYLVIPARIEPEIKSIVKREPIAFLSDYYSDALMDGINLVLFPVLQSYSAYTPDLDELNARWVDENGPRFLIFDGTAADSRYPWMEEPRTWDEVYRWYNTRTLSRHHLLLERRASPRFSYFKPPAHTTAYLGKELPMPASSELVFWTMQCPLTRNGRWRALVFRALPVSMEVHWNGGRVRTLRFRTVFPLLGAPSPGNYLPRTLAEFGALFDGSESTVPSVPSVKFESLEVPVYRRACDVEFLKAMR